MFKAVLTWLLCINYASIYNLCSALDAYDLTDVDLDDRVPSSCKSIKIKQVGFVPYTGYLPQIRKKPRDGARENENWGGEDAIQIQRQR